MLSVWSCSCVLAQSSERLVDVSCPSRWEGATRGAPGGATEPMSDIPPGLYGPDPEAVRSYPTFSAPIPPQGTLPPPASPLPAESVDYLHLLHGPNRRWWKPLVSLVVFIGLLVPLSALAVMLTLLYGVLSGVSDVGLWLDEQFSEGAIGPGAFLFGDLVLIAFIPAVLLSTWIVHRVRPGYVSSVVGRIRWRWLLRSAAVLTPLLLIYLWVSFLLDPPQSVRPAEWVVLLVMVLVLTPFQAAAEEYLFRGWIPQQLGAWLPWPRVTLVVATVVSAGSFAVLHGSADPWVLIDLVAFAVAASVITWRTGGLESAIALHAINNVAIGVLVLTFGGWEESFVSPGTTGNPVGASVAVVVQGAAVALVWWQARRVRVAQLHRPFAPRVRPPRLDMPDGRPYIEWRCECSVEPDHDPRPSQAVLPRIS